VDLSPDLVLRACQHVPTSEWWIFTTICASDDGLKTLPQLPKDTRLILILNTEHCHWRYDCQGRCNLKYPCLGTLQGSREKYAEAVKAVASALAGS
jgi:hypothetical protein